MFRPAHELGHRCDDQMRDVPFGLKSSWTGTRAVITDVQFPLPIRLV
jgi:hypothetical protein